MESKELAYIGALRFHNKENQNESTSFRFGFTKEKNLSCIYKYTKIM